jgi:sialic acid synthase SpsE
MLRRTERNRYQVIDVAKKLIDVPASVGCDAAKFQKRTTEVVHTKKEIKPATLSVGLNLGLNSTV